MNIPNVLTRQFVLHCTSFSRAAFLQVLHELADAWETLDIRRVRVFFAGDTRLYIVVSARYWIEDGIDADAESIFSQPRIQCRELSSYPYPRKRFVGTWRVFTTSDTLQHFVVTEKGKGR